MSGLLGSTYFGQEKPLEAENTLCLDANYQQGQTGATADGYGHFSTLTENRKVHATAYRTVKLMTRDVALYPDALSLQAEILKLFTHVGHAVKYSFLHPEEAGTASCVVTRLFETNNKHTLALVAAGVGDGWWRCLILKPKHLKRLSSRVNMIEAFNLRPCPLRN